MRATVDLHAAPTKAPHILVTQPVNPSDLDLLAEFGTVIVIEPGLRCWFGGVLFLAQAATQVMA